MFSWNFAKSAEAMLSRLAVKRVCKFLLKKKLGDFILGDIDLDQLDVQLTDGTLRLTDLALNVDYINQKLSAATSVIVKEGSIGSLLVQLPWKSKTCDLEVDELELFLAPCRENEQKDESGSHQDGGNCFPNGLEKPGHDTVENGAKASSGDVHEGVKAIAKMVKWILTSFHVRIKKLIIAFDPYLEKENRTCYETLVLRISEIECGTCVSNDVNVHNDLGVESILGISRLTNYVNFHGGILELLQMDDVEEQRSPSSLSGTTFSEFFSRCHPSYLTTPILTGKGAGFSGNFRLSIPWRNGSLDIRTVDADICIEPLELKLQPSVIKWLLRSWDIIINLNKDKGAHHAESIYLNATSQWQPSVEESDVIGNGKMTCPCGGSAKLSPLTIKEPLTEALLPESHIISDWVPFSVNRNEDNIIEQGIDLGASMDQFFECFDGMRNSQSALGSSGMWNWTCSVFSAITAASSLASGSLHVTSEQQHEKTNLRATVAGISIKLEFHDEDKKPICHLGNKDDTIIGSSVNYLGAECRDVFLLLQVSPQELKVEGKVKYIEMANYLSKDHGLGHGLQNPSIEQLQAEVQGALPKGVLCAVDVHSSGPTQSVAADCPYINGGDVMKVVLVKTAGTTHCQVTYCSCKPDGGFTGPRSFSLDLPPFVFWLDLHLVKRVLDLVKEVITSVEVNNRGEKLSSEAFLTKHESHNGDMNRGSGSCVTSLSSVEKMQGCVTIPNARVVLCFPFERGKNFSSHLCWNQFVAFDFSLTSATNKGSTRHTSPICSPSSGRRFSSAIRSLVQLDFGNLDVHLVTSASQDDISTSSAMQRRIFYAQKILSIARSVECLSPIFMTWQEGHVTGPWVAKRAKFLATSEEPWSRHKYVRKGYEFASATAMKNIENSNSQIRQEIILSSAIFLHVHLSAITISLNSSAYKIIHDLSSQLVDALSGVAYGADSVGEESSVYQTSIQVECDAVEILVAPDVKESIRDSLQKELPGAWNHLKLKVQKLDLLSVSNIGGNNGANFFWLAHGEGNLWGSITGIPGQEFLLISCSNSAMKRGDGGGSNALSSKLAGIDFVHLWEPENLHGFMSITLRCGTINAVGGRLDWFEAISSFFSLPSETDEKSDSGLEKDGVDAQSGASFVLNLVDIGLSYEPYVSNLIRNEVPDCDSSSLNAENEIGEPYVACLLAASYLNLSNVTAAHSISDEYKIRVQDLGLLLCQVSNPESLGGVHDVNNLHKMGYTKVAREALVEAILRTNTKNGLVWDVECSKSQIFVDTCHDTTFGLIRLASQLQQLFAPDLEESVVHLQTRWNNIQQAQETVDLSDEPVSPASQTSTSSLDVKSNPEIINLMDEICHNAFHMDENLADETNFYRSQVHIPLDGGLFGEPYRGSIGNPDISSDISFSGSMPAVNLECAQASFSHKHSIPQVIEGYCLSELCPSLEISADKQTSAEILELRTTAEGNEDFGRENNNNGWYSNISPKIVENHVADVCEEDSPKQSVKEEEWTRPINTIGRLLLKDINISWRMYGGSDWHRTVTSGHHSKEVHGRDTTACMELMVSGLNFQYDVFPVGGIPASKLSVSVQDFHLNDNSRDAPWKLVLGHYHSKDHPRESFSKAFKLDLEAVRPDPSIPLEEYRLRIAFCPMVLHLHQSQLDFLISFFGTRSSKVDQSLHHYQDSGISRSVSTEKVNISGHTIAEEALLPYFQKFDIWPSLIRFDYQPSRVDLAALRGGNYVELVNLVPWKGVELQLKHVHAVGVYGWGSVCETIIGEWLEDISQNQIRKVLHGLPTIRSLVAVGSGAAKLVSLPVENYRKDHRVVKGMQRGTIAFLRSISLEAIGLGVHLAAGAHEILLQAEYILASIQPSIQRPVQRRKNSNVRSNQPNNAQQGMQQAYESLSDGLGKSASALVRTPLKKYQRGSGAGSALASAVRAVPTATIAPVSACASAVHSALIGLRNSLDPEHKKESFEKYLGPTPHQNPEE